MHSADDLVMCLGDCNGHVGRHIDGFDGVHGGCWSEEFGRMNVIRVLFGIGIMCQIYGLREEKRKVAFRMGENEK